MLTENIEENLTKKIWDDWTSKGLTKYWTYIEVKHLADRFIKLCREQKRDPREFDLSTILNSYRGYEENCILIDEQFFGDAGAPTGGKEAMQQLNDKFKENYGCVITSTGKAKDILEIENTELTKQQAQTQTELKDERQKRTELEKKINDMLTQQEKEKRDRELAKEFLHVSEHPKQEKIEYSKEELLEIINYLKHRKDKKTKDPTKPSQLKKLYSKIKNAGSILKDLGWIVLGALLQ